MINKEFFQALDDLEKEQRIPKESMIESIEAGLVSAYKKEYGFASQISVRLNEEKMTYKVYAHKLVVEEVEDEESQISLEDAQDIDKKYKIGDVVIEDITPKDFSRIAAQTAKQVILQRINDYKKELVLNEMSERTGEILSAIVRRKEGNTVYVEITGTQMEGVMMQQDQVPTETYNVNDVIKVYVKKIRDGLHGAQVVVSRSSAGFVRRLFELEVPEIKAGLVKINSIVREAGFRTKLAVSSEDPNVDAVGACIGPKRSRITAVVNELNGEKIDIINWSDNPAILIENALSPAKVISVMAENSFFNGVFASYIRTMRSPVGFKLAVLFCESCRKGIHRKAAKFLPLFLDVLIRPAFDTVPDHIHVVALDILKIMEDFIQRRW